MVKHLTAQLLTAAIFSCTLAGLTPAQKTYNSAGFLKDDTGTRVAPPCDPDLMTLLDGSEEDGPDGNTRTFDTGNIRANVRAFSRRISDGLWETAFLGSFNGVGLGVTDRGEGAGENDTHKLDNLGDRTNFAIFEFDQDVVVDRIFLESVGADSDITIWIGTAADPFNNPITLSDAALAGFGASETNNGSNSARWAEVNGTLKSGNVLVIAARTNDADFNDAFKVKYLDLECPPPDTDLPARVLIIKEVVTVSGGTSSNQSFGFTAANLGTANFALIDRNIYGPDRFGNSNITQFGAANTITVTESFTGGWSLSDLTCSETGGTLNSTIDFTNRRVNIVAEPGESIVCRFRNTQFAPSASFAPISGRVTAANGNGVRGAVLTLLNVETGETQIAQTGSFGYYTFEAQVGSFYLLTVEHKRHFFAENTRSFTLNEDLAGVDFVEAF